MKTVDKLIKTHLHQLHEKLAESLAWSVRMQTGKTLDIRVDEHTNKMMIPQSGTMYPLSYRYMFNPGEILTHVTLQYQLEDNVPVDIKLRRTPEIHDLYVEISKSLYLAEQCIKSRHLSDEAMQHHENWNDCIIGQ